jgi:hypothetical protein
VKQKVIDLTITLDDGPLTCIYKVMHGKGWMSVPEVVKALESCHYKENTIRAKLSRSSDDLIERKETPRQEGQVGHIPRLYRLVEGAKMPKEATRPTEKQREMKRAAYKHNSPFSSKATTPPNPYERRIPGPWDK